MSNDMKLIMESWRTNQLLLESGQKNVINFAKNIASNKVSDEKIEQVFDKLEKNEDFLKLVDIFKKLEEEPIEEGALLDAEATVSIKGMQLMDYIKRQPGGNALLKASGPIMAMAYIYTKIKMGRGDLDPTDLQSAAEIATKGTSADLVDIATGGG
jgi:hypothetical protein